VGEGSLTPVACPRETVMNSSVADTKRYNSLYEATDGVNGENMKEDEIVLKIEDYETDLGTIYMPFFDWLGIYGIIKIHEILVTNPDLGYRYELVVKGKNGRGDDVELKYPMFWDYGNYFEPDKELVEALTDYQGIYIDEEIPWNVVEKEQFIIYNEKREEFMVIEFVKFKDSKDWTLTHPGYPFNILYNPKEHMTFKFPKDLYEKWIDEEIYWKRPYTLTIDYHIYSAFLNRRIRANELRLILVLRTIKGHEYILTGRTVYKIESIYEEENYDFDEPHPY